MPNLVLGLITIATLMAGVLTFTITAIGGSESNADAYVTASETRGQIDRSSLRYVPGCVVPLGETITGTIENDGQSVLRDFGDWDVVAHYQSSGSVSADWMSYTATVPAASGEWTLSNIRLVNGRSEAFGAGELDPGERATVTVELPSGAIASGLNKLTISTREGAVVEIPFVGTTTCGYYLHNNPSPPSGDTTSQVDLLADAYYPSASTLYNYDTDRDALAGLVVLEGGSGASEADLTQYQNWQTAALTQPLKLSGTVRVAFWAAVKDFSTSLRGDVTVYLRDYDGASYTEIGNVTVTSDPWDTLATGTWIKATAAITGLNYTVPIGNQLEIKMIVPSTSAEDMWLAYDTLNYPASVTYADSLDLVFHSDEQRTGDLTSFLAKEGPHDDGYYLHNNPTPPVLGTTSQANLTASTSYPAAETLVNYDTDRDAQAGLIVLQGGSGASESDLTQYQNWRTPVLTEPLAISGPVSINIWSAVKDFSTSLTGELQFFLRDYDGSSYTEIGNGTITATPWDVGATGTWVNRLLEIPSLDYTLAPGHQIELKVIVGAGSADDMWLAYDTETYDSVMRLSGQRDEDPGGRPRTVIGDAGAGTGRFAAEPNGGRVLYSLEGYTRITDTTWTMKYRIRRDGFGFVWRTDGADITPGSSSAWVTVDLSPYVPAGAEGAIVEIINLHASNALSAVVRGTEDTRDYMPDVGSQKLPGKSHRWQIVKVDSNLEIDVYVEDISNMLVNLVGHTLGEDPFYFTTPPDITPGSTGAWTAVNVSSQVPEGATGVVLLIDATGAKKRYGVRETGSSYSTTNLKLENEGNTMFAVGIDADNKFDIYLEDSSVKVYMVASVARSLVFYIDDIAIPDPTLGSWQPFDADTYSIPDGASGLLLYMENTDNKKNEVGIRKAGSTDDFEKRMWPNGHFQGGVGLDVNNVWEAFLDAADVDVSIAAYTTGVNLGPTTLHADMDVLVRKANGELRDTLAIEVADSLSVDVTNAWLTITATFSPTEYVVVDQTDYLEFQLFAHVTINDGADTTMQFRLDDNTVALDDQTGARNVGLYRE